MSATSERDQASRIARNDFERALRIARNIGDPWFRCQAIACVAWHASDDKQFLGLVSESLESGWSLENPNRSVSVVAWPLAALARRQFTEPAAMKRGDRELRSAIDRLSKVIVGEISPASRADALLLHVHALSPSRPEQRKGVLSLLVRECRNPANWKRQRQLEEAALVVAADDPDSAIALAAPLDQGRRQRTSARIEQQPALLGPRPFFDISDT